MIKVEIVTPERVVHTTEGDEILLPTVTGQIGVRKGHLPLITLLKAGQIMVKRDSGEEEVLAMAGGFAEVSENAIHILADTAERVEELDEAKVREAMARAEKLKAEATDQHSYADAAAQIAANLARLKAIQRKRSHGHHSRPE